MSGFQEKINQRKRETSSAVLSEVEPLELSEESQDELSKSIKFFGIENIKGYPTCIDFRFSSGNCKAVPYSYIVEVNFEVSEGIEILTAVKKIIIKGRNLQLLYHYLLAFRVKYIQENIGHDITDEGMLFVKSISINEE